MPNLCVHRTRRKEKGRRRKGVASPDSRFQANAAPSPLAPFAERGRSRISLRRLLAVGEFGACAPQARSMFGVHPPVASPTTTPKPFLAHPADEE
jgi:hypothetical protein